MLRYPQPLFRPFTQARQVGGSLPFTIRLSFLVILLKARVVKLNYINFMIFFALKTTKQKYSLVRFINFITRRKKKKQKKQKIVFVESSESLTFEIRVG